MKYYLVERDIDVTQYPTCLVVINPNGAAWRSYIKGIPASYNDTYKHLVANIDSDELVVMVLSGVAKEIDEALVSNEAKRALDSQIVSILK